MIHTAGICKMLVTIVVATLVSFVETVIRQEIVRTVIVSADATLAGELKRLYLLWWQKRS